MAYQILHLAAAHSPTDARIVEREATTLAEAGYRVGYVVPAERDQRDGPVQVLSVPLAASGAERLTRTARAVVARAEAEANADTVFHVHEPELLPWVLARPSRRFVYDAHEDVPRQALQQHWIPRPFRRPASWGYAALEAVAGRRAAHVFAAVPAIAERFPDATTSLLRNYPVRSRFAPSTLAGYGFRDPWVVYVGGISALRGLEEMMRAVALLPASLKASLRLAGPFFPANLAERAEDGFGADRTVALGRLERDEVAALLARSRVGLVTLHPAPNHLVSLPVKLFEYMAAGLPVVASDFPLWREIVEEAGCGLLVDPLDPGAIAGALEDLLTHPAEAAAMGQRGRAAVEARFAWEHEAPQLLAAYRDLLGPPAPSGASC